LKYCPKRIEKIQEYCDKNGVVLTDDNIIEMMDKWLIDLWNSQVSKKDVVYILGDFSFHNAEENKRLLSKLNGKKFLILGNHDGNSDKLDNYFEQITQIKELKYKDESGETFCFEMCHYAMVTWNRKERGTIQLHGHSHGALDGFNAANPDLRVDVGLDGHLANYRFLTPDDILVYFYKKSNTKDFNKYMETLRSPKQKENNKFKQFIKWFQEAIGLC
jgi:calcineurin-like phosphoesterase family protein